MLSTPKVRKKTLQKLLLPVTFLLSSLSLASDYLMEEAQRQAMQINTDSSDTTNMSSTGDACQSPEKMGKLLHFWSEKIRTQTQNNQDYQQFSESSANSYMEGVCTQVNPVLSQYGNKNLLFIAYAGRVFENTFGYAVIDVDRYLGYQMEVYQYCKTFARNQAGSFRQRHALVRQCLIEKRNEPSRPYVLASDLKVADLTYDLSLRGAVAVTHAALPTRDYYSFGMGAGVVSCPEASENCMVGYSGIYIDTEQGFDKPYRIPTTVQNIPVSK